MLAMPTHIGADLKAERERRGLTLARVAEELRVQPRFLQAIEDGPQYDEGGVGASNLPSVGYQLGYVRAYADFVGLSGDVAVKRYKADAALPRIAVASDTPRSSLSARNPVRAGLPRGLVPAFVVLAAALGFAAYYGLSGDSAPTTPGTVETPLVSEAIATGDRPYLLADTSAWVRVRDANGEVLLSAILVPGQSQPLPEGAVTLDVRDGGAIRLGRGSDDLGTLGARGQSVEDLDLALRLKSSGSGADAGSD